MPFSLNWTTKTEKVRDGHWGGNGREGGMVRDICEQQRDLIKMALYMYGERERERKGTLYNVVLD